jgi:uncharacterized membrane protein
MSDETTLEYFDDQPSHLPSPGVVSQDWWLYLQNGFLAVVYPDKNRAAKVLTLLMQLQSPKLADLEDAVFVTRDKKGTAELHQPGHGKKKNTVGGSIVGLVVGTFLLGEIGGDVLKEDTPQVRSRLRDVQIQESFSEELRKLMQPDSSAIFLLVRQASPGEVIPRIIPYGGTVLETSISRDEQAHLRDALKAARAL